MPPAGKALVRIIHAAPEAGSVDLYAAGKENDPVIDNVGYGAPVSYREVDPADSTLRVESKSVTGDAKQRAAGATVERSQFQAGKAYTVVVTAGDQPGQPVKIVTIEDPLAAPLAAEADQPATGKEPATQKEEDFELKPDVEPLRDDQPAPRLQPEAR